MHNRIVVVNSTPIIAMSATLGVILKAKENGIVKEVKPLILDLKDNGIYISENLFMDVLKMAGE